MSAENILHIENVNKIYKSAGKELTVLNNINFSVAAGSTLAITGPSGSGKTTLLGLCAGLDRASSGSVILNGVNLDQLNEDQRAAVGTVMSVYFSELPAHAYPHCYRKCDGAHGTQGRKKYSPGSDGFTR